MAHILITGGAGFIGSHLTPALLAAGHSVRILDTLSPQIHGELPEGTDWLGTTGGVEFIRGSVTSREDLTRAIEGVDAIVHLASETGTGQSMDRVAPCGALRLSPRCAAPLCGLARGTSGNARRSRAAAVSRKRPDHTLC